MSSHHTTIVELRDCSRLSGNSVAASSSSLKMARCISLISSRNVSMEVREVKVSSVHEFSLHCSISSSILLTVLCMVSFTFRSPKGVPCVFQVSNRLSHALVVSSILSRKKTTPASTQKGDLISYFVSFGDIFVREFRYCHASQRFYPRIPLFLGIFHI